jgi:hypothetical protein
MSTSAEATRTVIVERRVIEETQPRVVSAAPSSGNPEEEPKVAPPTETTEEEIASNLEAKFQTDVAPTAEARQTESTLRNAFSGPQAQGVVLQNLECRAATCRAEIVFSDLQTDKRFLRTLLLDPTTKLSLPMNVTIPTRVTRDDGSVIATMYLDAPEAPETDPVAGG